MNVPIQVTVGANLRFKRKCGIIIIVIIQVLVMTMVRTWTLRGNSSNDGKP